MIKLQLVGQKFNRLTVISEAENQNNHTAWHCLCDCGKSLVVLATNLTRNHTKSCGCLNSELVTIRNTETTGILSGRWRGGQTPINNRIRGCKLYQCWRLSVYERDNFTCFLCKKSGVKLNSHHIIPFSQLLETNAISTLEEAKNCSALWNIENGISLCENCHLDAHNSNYKFVWKKWGAEHWIELNKDYCFKKIFIRNNTRTSLQYHEFKHETTYVHFGSGILWMEDANKQIQQYTLSPGSFYSISPGIVHRVQAITDLILIEASTPQVDDCIRLEDDYGRTNGRIESEHSFLEITKQKKKYENPDDVIRHSQEPVDVPEEDMNLL